MSVAAYQRQQRAVQAAQARQQKIEDLQALAAQFQAILNVHRADFPPARPLGALWPPVPSVEDLYPTHEAQALRGISSLHPGQRKKAKEQARLSAEWHRQQLIQAATAEHDQNQRELDIWWQRLVGNDPETVMEALDDAFEDNDAPAAPVGVNGAEVTVVVLAPDLSAVPERWPEMTQAGNPSSKVLAKAKRNDFYNILILGHALATLRETFAVAPGLQAARIILMRKAPPDAYGREQAECLAAALFRRSPLEGVRWDIADAPTIYNQVSSEKLFRQAPNGELKPLDLTNEPDLRELLSKVDFDELQSEPTGQLP